MANKLNGLLNKIDSVIRRLPEIYKDKKKDGIFPEMDDDGNKVDEQGYTMGNNITGYDASIDVPTPPDNQYKTNVPLLIDEDDEEDDKKKKKPKQPAPEVPNDPTVGQQPQNVQDPNAQQQDPNMQQDPNAMQDPNMQ